MSDRLRLLARKDVADAIRDWELPVLGAVFLVIGCGVGYLVGGTAAGSSTALASAVVTTFLFLAPMSVLALSHDAIAGKRVDGELTVLLGLPYSRLEVVFGSLLGRFAVVGSVTVAGVVGAAFVGVLRGASPAPLAFSVGVLALLLVTLVFASLAIAASTASPNVTFSSAGAFGVFVLFVFRFWDLLPGVLDAGLDRLFGTGLPEWAGRFIANLAPYAAVRNALAPLADSAVPGFGAFTAPVVTDTGVLSRHPLVGGVVTLFWLVGPVGVAYWRFARADL